VPLRIVTEGPAATTATSTDDMSGMYIIMPLVVELETLPREELHFSLIHACAVSHFHLIVASSKCYLESSYPTPDCRHRDKVWTVLFVGNLPIT
jgi:hypothetical protein